MDPSAPFNAHRVSLTVRGNQAFFAVPWTALNLADRHAIAWEVPSVAGLYQVYWEDERRKLRIFSWGQAWYGGLRGKLAESIDQDHEPLQARKEILEHRRLWYRYVLCESWGDLQDLFCLYEQIFNPNEPPPASSGRFQFLHLRETPLTQAKT